MLESKPLVRIDWKVEYNLRYLFIILLLLLLLRKGELCGQVLGWSELTSDTDLLSTSLSTKPHDISLTHFYLFNFYGNHGF